MLEAPHRTVEGRITLLEFRGRLRPCPKTRRLEQAAGYAKIRRVLPLTGLDRVTGVAIDAATACRALLEEPDPEDTKEV